MCLCVFEVSWKAKVYMQYDCQGDYLYVDNLVITIKDGGSAISLPVQYFELEKIDPTLFKEIKTWAWSVLNKEQAKKQDSTRHSKEVKT